MSATLTRFEPPRNSITSSRPGNSITVSPGEPATPESFRRIAERNELLKLVRQFSIDGLSWRKDQTIMISQLTLQTAEKFLKTLPTSKAFPKIAPDGEGGLIMVWESHSVLLLTIDELRIHVVAKATTHEAEYHNDIVMGELIDRRILDLIPPR